MSVEAIVDRIVDESETEAAAILAEADGRAMAVIDAAQAERDDRVATALARGQPALRAEETRRLNAARLRRLEQDGARAARRTAAAFELAAARLDAIAAGGDPERWAGALRSLAAEALTQAGDRSVVRIRARDAAAIEDLVAATGGRLDLSDEAQLPAGILVRSADGRLEVDATLPTRLERASARLAETTARLLGIAG